MRPSGPNIWRPRSEGAEYLIVRDFPPMVTDVRGDGFRGAGELEKHVAGGIFDDRAEHAIARLRRAAARHAVVIAGDVDGGYREPMNGSLTGFANAALELA